MSQETETEDPGWLVSFTNGYVDCVPVNDLVAHEYADDCVCGPDVGLVDRDEDDLPVPGAWRNRDVWFRDHQSLDRREDVEDDEGGEGDEGDDDEQR